jgi:hypothetical protein
MPVIMRFVSKVYGVDSSKYELIDWHDDKWLSLCYNNSEYDESVWFHDVTTTTPIYLSFLKSKPEKCAQHIVI